MNHTPYDIRYYLYLDTDGINSLYHQISSTKIDTKFTTTDHIEGDVSGSVGSEGLLKHFISAEAGATINAHHQETHETQTIVSYEHKIKYIQEQLSLQKIERLEDIINSCPYTCHKLIACKAIFRLMQAFDEDSKVSLTPSQIAQSPYKYNHLSLIFQTTQSINCLPPNASLLSNAVDANEYFVDMILGKEKMVRRVRHITTELKYGKDFMFFLLGELSHEGNKIYCLKPYAVWRQTNQNM